MKQADVLAVRSSDIAVHAIGPGYGESIVLTIGGRLVLGIDCCSALVQPTLSGPSYLEQLLSQCEKNPYIVWVVTHFHFDHFQNFSRLLDLLQSKITKLVVPDDYLSADLGQLAREAESDKSVQTLYLAKQELSWFRSQLRTLPLAERVRYFGGHGPHDLLALELEFAKTDRRIPVHVEVFAPRYDVARDVKGEGVRQARAGMEKRSAANHTSYITRVRAGRFESLFLGDSPAKRSATCSLSPDPASEVFLLKVAHHGAADGTNRSFLTKLKGNAKERIALICPFRVHKLPKPAVLELLQEFGFNVKISGSDSPSSDLKERIMSQTASVIDGADLKVYQHESSVAVVQSRA